MDVEVETWVGELTLFLSLYAIQKFLLMFAEAPAVTLIGGIIVLFVKKTPVENSNVLVPTTGEPQGGAQPEYPAADGLSWSRRRPFESKN